MLIVNIFLSTIPLPHGMMPLLTARTNGSQISLSDAWARKWDKKLWINPPFHLILQVIHKIKQDKTRAILVVPLTVTH